MTISATETDDAVDVILRDGTTLRLRPPEAADADSLVAFVAGLSRDSLYRRFHGYPRIDTKLVESFLDPDWAERGALIGVIADGGAEQIVALADYATLRDPALAEVAFAVADEYQRRGVGSRLLEQPAATPARGRRGRAASRGDRGEPADARRLHARRVRGHARARRRRDRAALPDRRDRRLPRAGRGPATTLPSPPRCARSRRELSPDRRLAAPRLDRRRASSATSSTATSRGGVPGQLEGEPVAGVRATGRASDIPDPIDLAVICVPSARVLDAAESALRSGVRALCVISSGFAELGWEGREPPAPARARPRHGARLPSA